MLISSALAQASELTKTAQDTAGVFLTQGPLGAVIVAEGLVIIAMAAAIAYLFRKLDAQSTTITGMVKETTVALQANTAATMAGNVTISALDRTLHATDDGVEKLSRQTELTAQDARSRGEAILKNQESILRRLEDRRA